MFDYWDRSDEGGNMKDKGIPYTLDEAIVAARIQQMDPYHRDLILWLCDQLEEKKEEEDD